MTVIPKSITDRIATLRPRLHPFDRIEPAKTALVVIDLQNMFMAEGAIYEVPSARAIVGNVNRLADALRRAGGLVVWVQMKYDPADPWRNFYDNMLKPETAKAVQAALTPGSPGFDLFPALEPKDGDLYVEKTRFSAFLPNSSDIAAQLRARGIDTVLVTGTVTNTCCESSARDAMMMDFKTIMIEDANAAPVAEAHNAALANFLQVLGDVRATEEVVALLARAAVAPA